MLCDTCTRILRGEVPVESYDEQNKLTTFLHHCTIAALKAAAEEQRCYYCRPLWCKLTSETQQAIESLCQSTEHMAKNLQWTSVTKARIHPDAIAGQRIWQYSIWLNYTLRGDLDRINHKEFTPLFYSLQPLKHNIDATIKTPSESSTGSQTSLQQALEWLRHCVQWYKECNSRADRGSWNPTRLIDVGNAGASLVRLVSDTHAIGTVRYLTLSHCWGKAQFIRLTTQSAQRLQAGIAISALPKTFRDAIKVTRFLTVRYLWIDSLCIIQDPVDLSDWTKEASLMNKVYAHGTLNISATTASDSLQGLFFERRASDFHTQAVDFAFDEEGMRCGNIEACYTVENHFWFDYVDNAPVNKRAWVLQERLLAKRVLHFGQTQMFWECAELEAAEEFPNGLPKMVLTSHVKFKDAKWNTADYDQLGEYERKITDRYGKWNDIVGRYTSARLSSPQDKLVAVAGLAKEMNKQIQDHYVAGMWREHLAGQLLWIRTWSEPLVLRTVGYRAPTWSWASCDFGVSHLKWAYSETRFEVADVSLQYKSRDAFGLLTGGHVVLTGILKRIGLQRVSSLPSDPPLMKINGRSVASEIKGIGVHLDHHIPDHELLSANEVGSLFALEAHYSIDLVVLLLLRVEDRDGGVFSRIGVASSIEGPEIFLRALERDEDESNLPSMRWNAENRTHTICVI